MDVIQEYFVNPILYNEGYNPVNTLAYGLVLIFATYMVYGLLKKLKVKIDLKFASSVIPFIFLGSTIRVLEDSGVYQGVAFISPFIYFLTFAIFLSALLVSVLIQKCKGIEYYKTMIFTGSALFLSQIIFLNFKNFFALGVILSLTFISSFMLFLAGRYVPKILTKTNVAVTSVHMLDASATFTALTFYSAYFEQHFVPSFFVSIFGPVAIFVLKLTVVVPTLFLFDRYVEDKNFRNFLKIVVLILGLAPGVRDMLRLLCMV